MRCSATSSRFGAASDPCAWQQGRDNALTDRQIMDKEPGAFRTISEVAEELDVPQHVLRFWETRFSQIRPLKRGGGRRFYRPEDVLLIRGIRHLLYGEGYTIKGVQRILKEEGVRHVQQAAGGDASDAADIQEWPNEAPGSYEFQASQGEGEPDADDDLPSVVRPRPYAAQHHNADVMASPPVAGWRDDACDPAEHIPAPGAAQDVQGGPYSQAGQYGDGGDAGDALHARPAPAGSSHDVAGHALASHAFPDQGPARPAPSTQGYQRFDAPVYDEQVESTGPEPYGAAPHAQSHVQPLAPDFAASFASGEVMSTSPRLDAGQRARLQEALAELLECRRLLAHARGDMDAAD